MNIACQGQVPEVTFDDIKVPSSPNFYLVCPDNYCDKQAHDPSPIFKLSLTELDSRWQTMITQQPRISIIRENSATHEYTYVQRTKWLRFPDYIDVKLIEIDKQHSSLIIFSRSKYGYSDLGVNQRRVKSWLATLLVV